MSPRVITQGIFMGLLALLALCTLILGAFTFAPALAGFQTYAVRSPSMAPAIPQGSLAIVDPRQSASEIRAGDVLAFKMGDADENVCVHRANAIDQKGGLIETKGDANESPDLRLVPFEDVSGTVCAHIPHIGTALAWTSANKPLIPTAAAILALAIASVALASPKRTTTGSEKKGRA